MVFAQFQNFAIPITSNFDDNKTYIRINQLHNIKNRYCTCRIGINLRLFVNVLSFKQDRHIYCNYSNGRIRVLLDS